MDQERSGYSIRPFPDIPRLPDEPPLAGPPASLAETALYKDPLPFTMNRLLDYQEALKTAEKRGVATIAARYMVTDPEKYLGVYTSLLTIEANNPGKYSLAIASFQEDIEDILEQQAKTLRPALPEEQIGGFLELAAKNPGYKEKAERIIRGFIHGAQTQKEIIDLFYRICCYALASRDSDIEKFTVELLSYATDIFTSKDKQAIMFTTAAISTDDETLARFFDIDHTAYLLRQMHNPALHQVYKENSEFLLNSPGYHKYLKEAAADNPHRLQAITAHYQLEESLRGKPANDQSIAFEPGATPPFPINLIQQPRVLRELYWQRYTEFLASLGVHNIARLTLPDGSLQVLNIDLLQDVPEVNVPPAQIIAEASYDWLKEIYLRKDGGVVDNEKAIACALTTFKPYFPQDNPFWTELDNLKENSKQALWEEVTRSLNPRGYRIIVEDEQLLRAGIREIFFELGKTSTGYNLMETRVTLVIGNYRIPLLLDHHHTLKLANGKNIDINKETRIWWETNILSYLYPLTCRENQVEHLSPKGETLQGEEAKEAQKEYIQRCAHRRKLPPNQIYTQKQAERVKDMVDLAAYNTQRGLTRNTGMYTWVKPENPVKIDGKRNPYNLKIPQATEKIKDILIKQQLS